MIDRRTLEQFAQIQRQISDPAFQRFIANAQKAAQALQPTAGQQAKIARALQPAVKQQMEMARGLQSAIEQHARLAQGAFKAMQSAQVKDITSALDAARKAYGEFVNAQNKARVDLNNHAKALQVANEAMDRAIRNSRSLGLSYRDIAKETGFSHERVRRLLTQREESGNGTPDDDEAS
jgi:hypothetical protein